MEHAMMSVATGAMKSLLGKLSALLVGEFNLEKEVRRDIESMEDELSAMNAFLVDMAPKMDDNPDQRTKLRVRAVRELSYDIEDCIDEFMLLDHKNSKPGGLRKIVGTCQRKIVEIKTTHQVGKEIKSIQKRIEEAADRHMRYNEAGTSMNPKVRIDPRVCFLFRDASQLVGLDAQTEKIIGLLARDDALSMHQKVVSIVGPGGLGKTTLAKQVYDRLKGDSECCAFVTVSQNPDVMVVLREIMSQVRNVNYANTEAGSVQYLIDNIRDYLNDKRYFVVVDDIWDTCTLEYIKSALPDNCHGSRVLATTRIHDVAKSWCSSIGEGIIYKMEPLSDVASRRLFLRRILRPTESFPTHLEGATKKILRKCDGIPLAIITIASMLARKPITEENLSKVVNYIYSASGNSTEIDAMRRILSLSYVDLPFHLRTCLLYLSIFPEDYIIEKEELIDGWIAEGFIQGDGEDAQVVGKEYLDELINRSLIEPFHDSQWFLHDEAGETTRCKVHDVILGFIVSMSIEGNFVALCGVKPVPQNKIRRLSVQHHDQTRITEWNKEALHHVRSLVVFRSAGKMPWLSKFKFLRYLEVKPDVLTKKDVLNIGKLFYMRHLRLRGNQVLTKLPEGLRKMQYLETLDLRRCLSLNELPSTITELQQLVRLYVSDHVKLPEHIGKLENLEELTRASIYSDGLNDYVLPELAKLRKLRVLEDVLVYSHDEEVATCLSKLGAWSLRSLYLNTRQLGNEETWSFTAPKLRELRITSSSFPCWLGSLQTLQKLVLKVYRFGQQDMKTIASGIPELFYLSITSTIAGKIVVGDGHFMCLESFHFDGEQSPVGVGLWFEDGAMPKLRSLHLSFHVTKTKKEYGGFDFGIQHLRNLARIHVSATHSHVAGTHSKGIVDDNKAAITRYFNELPCRPIVNIEMWYDGGPTLSAHINRRMIEFEDKEKDKDNELEEDNEPEKSNKKHKPCHN